tara:strand:+ start:682 stop:1857 length:1176 start_codon:yes stop_codon:yes gene_type:complete
MLTNQFIFQPERIIKIGDVVYAVFFDTDEELGDFPILAKVDSMSFIQPGTNIEEFDEQKFAATFGYVFRGHEDLLVSEIQTGAEQQDYRSIMDVQENLLATRAEENGMQWLLDNDVQAAFLAATLTGTPISTDDLADTAWYQNTSEEQRNYMVRYYADPNAVNEEISQNVISIRESMLARDMKGPVNELAKVLAYGLTTRIFKTKEEVDMYIDFIDDSTYLDLLGGEDLLPESLRGFVGQFTGVNEGQATTANLIVNKLGAEALESYKTSGEFIKMAAQVKAGNKAGVEEQLQKIHDTLYPGFAGSSFSTWNPYYTNRASRIINGTTGGQIVPLNNEQQEQVNQLIAKANGDYQAFDALVRSTYKDSPGVKNSFLSDLTKAIPQTISGVFG